ncbi:type II secretion system protein GspM [Pseudomonas aeruginosa]
MQSARQCFTEQRALHAYIQQQAPNVRQADAAGATGADRPGGAAGHGHGFGGPGRTSVERLDSEGEGAVQVALQPAPFAKLLPWLEQLNGQGVQVAEAGLDRQVDGRVSARLEPAGSSERPVAGAGMGPGADRADRRSPKFQKNSIRALT